MRQHASERPLEGHDRDPATEHAVEEFPTEFSGPLVVGLDIAANPDERDSIDAFMPEATLSSPAGAVPLLRRPDAILAIERRTESLTAMRPPREALAARELRRPFAARSVVVATLAIASIAATGLLGRTLLQRDQLDVPTAETAQPAPRAVEELAARTLTPAATTTLPAALPAGLPATPPDAFPPTPPAVSATAIDPPPPVEETLARKVDGDRPRETARAASAPPRDRAVPGRETNRAVPPREMKPPERPEPRVDNSPSRTVVPPLPAVAIAQRESSSAATPVPATSPPARDARPSPPAAAPVTSGSANEPATREPAKPASVPAATAAAATAAVEQQEIERVLGRFRTAFNDLNAGAAQTVWPTVDAKALEKAFDSLEEQGLEFAECQITVNGARAVAACGGTARYVTKVGRRQSRTESRRWKFDLRKTERLWVIEGVDAR